MANKKDQVCKYIDEQADRLRSVSSEIYANPELKLKEYDAARLLVRELEKGQFAVTLGVGGLDTAISAVHPEESEGPSVAIIGEYDALPELGHACGHNLIAAAALGASLAVGSIKDQLPGKLVFCGTPGEEGGGGKVTMVKEGVFDGIDVAMMFHPADKNIIGRGSLAISEVMIEFTGRSSHAAGSPEKGINALDAVIQTFNGINALRQHMRDDARIHGIITDGGAKPNIVPEHAAANFYVRALRDDYRDELLEKLRTCAEGAAMATGAKLSFEIVGMEYQAMKPNRVLGKVFTHNLELLGESIHTPKDKSMGSTDMGDVSQVVPAIHPYMQICDKGVAGHSREFAKAAMSQRGHNVMLKAAKAMAMSVIDVLTNDELVIRTRQEFLGNSD